MTEAQTGYSDTLPIGHRLEEFRIEALLGQGGFSKVYRATDTTLERVVAIKEYLPTQLAVRDSTTVHPRSGNQKANYQWGLRRFLAEARLLAQVDHPNVVRILRVFEANNTAYFVMPFERGVDLRTFLRKRGPLGEQDLVNILLPVLDAMGELHRRGIFHRDLKPRNIIIRRGMQPLLIDFGAARTAFGQHTHSIPIMSAGYSPIEHHTNDVATGPYTDIYALGATCYYAIGGGKPADALMRTAAHSQGKPDPLLPARQLSKDRYSPALLQAIDWALAVLPNDRPQSVADWLAQFPHRQTVELAPEAEIEINAALQDSRLIPSPTRGLAAMLGTPSDWLRERLAEFRRLPRRQRLIGLSILVVVALLWMIGGLLQPDPAVPEVSGTPGVVPSPEPPERVETTTDTPVSPPTRVEQLLAEAEAQIQRQRLAAPRGDNAFESYSRVLELEPDNAEARAGLRRITSIYLEWARSMFASRQFERSLNFVRLGLQVSPQHAELLQLQKAIQERINER